ncbi:MAG: hypothetical protein BKP49_00575 [Treponema sp. CETP13]|nr:MAG: hypothetical protein BKP49_00575 [Treponema sp. CETP13]
MKPVKNILKNIEILLLALSIPALLALDSVESQRYNKLNSKVNSLEKTEGELIESNKRLINDIGLLSSSSRIEKLAQEDLNMHKASSNEIVRIEIKDK